MNCQEHNYFHPSPFLLKEKLGYIKGEIQISDLYGFSALEFFQ